MYIHTYIYIYIYTHTCVDERASTPTKLLGGSSPKGASRPWKRATTDFGVSGVSCVVSYVYIYIYIYICIYIYIYMYR